MVDNSFQQYQKTIGDVCDECTDTDEDGYGNPGFPSNTCSLNNCPEDYNPNQEDFDADGEGNVCDLDDDNDEISDDVNNCPSTIYCMPSNEQKTLRFLHYVVSRSN